MEGYNEKFEITIPDDIIKNIQPIADFAKCIEFNAQQVVDYLAELKKDLGENEHIFDRFWEIPSVRACKINEEGEPEFVDIFKFEPIEPIEPNCSEYKTRIRELHDEIAQYEADIIELEKTFKQELLG